MATVDENPYIPHTPFAKQAEFLALECEEAFYGGAAGPGKSDGLLMAALQFIEVPGYAALFLMGSYTDLSLPNAPMDRAQDWLEGTAAHWHDKQKTWEFPSSATLTFGYLEHEADKYRYKGPEFQCVCFDEVAQRTLTQYLYLFSRIRRLKGSQIPLRMRSASNPEGPGYDWTKERFVDPGSAEIPFIRATLDDNPYIDREEYIKSLMHLDPITRARLLAGDWTVRPSGKKFKRHWFGIVDDAPADGRRVRYWDLAATEAKEGKDPDWTAGVLVAQMDGQFWVVDVVRERTTPGGVEALIKQTAELDGLGIPVWMEQEPGSAGVNTIDYYRRHVLAGRDFHADKTTGDKLLRMNPVSSAAEAGNVKLLRGNWNQAFLEEAESIGLSGGHDDQLDATAGAVAALTQGALTSVEIW